MSPASKTLAGVSIAAATAAAMYGLAAVTAGSAAEGFATQESSSHSRSVEFAAELRLVAAGHREARARCERVSGDERRACHAELRSDVKSALRSLR